MKMVRNGVLTTCLIVLGGCTVFDSFNEVEALNETQAVGSPFSQALADEYRTFSNRELKEMFDYPDALHFARKGLAAAAGETVMPEPVSDWNLDEPFIQELSAARGRLVIAFDLGAREIAAKEAAIAQSRFDCWIEQQEENWQDSDIAACKTEFEAAITALEGMIQAPDSLPPVSDVEGAPTAPLAPEDAVYLVFFNWDEAVLGSGALSVLDAVSAEVAKNPPAQINVIGHADTSGDNEYNQKLAFKRANTVRDALVERGVNASILMVDSKGESELLVETSDNVREPANRRVNISFQ
jgi:OOP family OmpA-OmpF porin